MNVLYYDCFSGISGDMHLGALVDLGVPADHLQAELSRLGLDTEFELRFERQRKMGITGTRALVRLRHGDHDGHGHHHSHGHHHHTQQRNLADIRGIIEASGLPEGVRKRATAIFEEIAVAEATVHGVEVGEVHFHEVGATDSIVDIVGAAICLEYLEVDRVLSRPVELGGGFVEMAHGTFPIPAPATAEILKSVPTTRGRAEKEMTTPTGAAILKATVNEFTVDPALTATQVGYGIGYYDLPVPNVLRVFLAEGQTETAADTYERGRNVLIETNIDDMSPEEYEQLMEVLFETGALDVFFTPIVMKKSRPATMVSVLARESRLDAIAAALFAHSSTFGLRYRQVEKLMVPREIREVSTTYGTVRVKVARNPLRWKVEYDDLKRIAASRSESIATVRAALAAEIRDSL
jgi:hypothetical protein